MQPPDPLEKWITPPFEPTIRDGRLYARGVSDDKGPMLIPILVAEAFVKTAGRLPVNIKMLIEGEEESGSPHFAPLVERLRDRLACDLVRLGRRRHVARRPAVDHGGEPRPRRARRDA